MALRTPVSPTRAARRVSLAPAPLLTKTNSKASVVLAPASSTSNLATKSIAPASTASVAAAAAAAAPKKVPWFFFFLNRLISKMQRDPALLEREVMEQRAALAAAERENGSLAARVQQLESNLAFVHTRLEHIGVDSIVVQPMSPDLASKEALEREERAFQERMNGLRVALAKRQSTLHATLEALTSIEVELNRLAPLAAQ